MEKETAVVLERPDSGLVLIEPKYQYDNNHNDRFIDTCEDLVTIETAVDVFDEVISYIEIDIKGVQKQPTGETVVAYYRVMENQSVYHLFNVIACMGLKGRTGMGTLEALDTLCFSEAQIIQYVKNNKQKIKENSDKLCLTFLFKRNDCYLMASIFAVDNFIEKKIIAYCFTEYYKEPSQGLIFNHLTNYLVIPII